MDARRCFFGDGAVEPGQSQFRAAGEDKEPAGRFAVILQFGTAITAVSKIQKLKGDGVSRKIDEDKEKVELIEYNTVKDEMNGASVVF